MNLQFIMAIQIVADVIFCLIIVILLARLKKSVDNKRISIKDQEVILNLQDLIGQSQKDSELFLDRLNETFQKFSQAAMQIKAKERRLTLLLEEIEKKTTPVSTSDRNRSSASDVKDYDSVVAFIRNGLSFEEISQQTHVPVGEIEFIGNLEKLKKMG
jgi:hypothetical protein